MKNVTIRTRLTLWYAGSLILLIALFGASIDGLMHERLLARTDFELDEELLELSLEVGLASNRATLLEQLELRFGSHNTFEFVVQDDSGNCVFASPGIEDVQDALQVTRATSERSYCNAELRGPGACRIGAEPAKGPDGPLSIAVLMPLGPNVAELRDLRILLLTVGPLIVAVAIGGGYWLARRSLQPIDQMTTTAARITAEETGERLHVVNAHDELGRLATTLNAMIDRLQQSLEQMRQFTADAAHEFRTPLAVIRSTAEVALRNPRAASYYEDSLQSIADEADRLTQMSNQLLLLAREDAGLNRVPEEPVDLSDIVQEVLSDLEPLLEQRQASCRLSRPAVIQGDSERLRRVFLNLIDNAVKYTEDGESISVRVDVESDTVNVTISDTGIGIAAEHLPHVLDRFYRVDSSHSRETGGTGLGLAICRAIVTAHNGRFCIRSAPGRGTDVCVSFPSLKVELPSRMHPNVDSLRKMDDGISRYSMGTAP